MHIGFLNIFKSKAHDSIISGCISPRPVSSTFKNLLVVTTPGLVAPVTGGGGGGGTT